jgi:DnaK suppressor protein
MSGPEGGAGGGGSAPPLSAHQVDELRGILEGELRRLERSLGFSAEALKPVELDQTAVGRLSRIDNLQNQGLTRNLHDRERARIGAVVAALGRIESGDYGRCGGCGGWIAYGRLLVMPEAEDCGGCEH